jgi:hypothetical protein
LPWVRLARESRQCNWPVRLWPWSDLNLLRQRRFRVPWSRANGVNVRPVRLAYQPPANSTFLSEQTIHQQPARTSQQYSSLRTNQHQPSATSQPNRPIIPGHI